MTSKNIKILTLKWDKGFVKNKLIDAFSLILL